VKAVWVVNYFDQYKVRRLKTFKRRATMDWLAMLPIRAAAIRDSSGAGRSGLDRTA
jgi:hypothetical protein